MTYQIHRYDDRIEVVASDGTVLDTLSYPVSVPDDIIETILDDMEIGNPQKKAFKVLFKQDWETVDKTDSS